MKKYTLALLISIIGISVFAQGKLYTLQDAVTGLYSNLAIKNINQLSWIPGEDAYAYADETYKAVLRVELPSMKEDTIFTFETINNSSFPDKDLGRLPQINWIDGETIYFRNKNDYYIGSLDDKKWTFNPWITLPDGAADINIEKTSRHIAYTIKNNLYLIAPSNKTHAVTKDEDPNIVNGQVVSRYEIGIDKGTFFSPSGKYLAFYRKDESKVTDYPVIQWDVTPAKNVNEKYPMAGADSEEVWLGVFNTETRETVYIDTGRDTDHYLTNITWAPDEKHIYIGIVTRDQKHLTLNKYNASTGKLVKTLFEEKDDKYVHPVHPLYFIPDNENEFIWWTERDGFYHLYRYNTDGKLLNQVTSGEWLVNEINGWNTATKEIIISTTMISPLNRNIFAVNWETGAMRRLDKEEGVHSVMVNSNGTYIIDRYSNYSRPRVIQVTSTDGKWSKTLLEAESTLTDYAQPEVRHFAITADDDKTALYSKLILPPDFDASQKYPVIVYLYNGPGVQLLRNSFPESGNLWYDYMAQRGYIVFTMDGRGSSNRGKEFEQVVHRNLGAVEMKDQLRGVEFLKALPYVDSERIGVHGWSYGGFMTLSLMLNHPDVYAAGVAGGPVVDWNMYEIMYTERYMDSPQENPEGYKNTSVLNKVSNLKGDLLVIHGALDATVVLQHSMKFLRECVKNGVQIDYFTYPAHPHNVRGKDRIHLMQKVTDYFDAKLGNH